MPRFHSLLRSLMLTVSLLIIFAATAEVPHIKHDWVRNKVANRVFMIKGTPDGGGGTGFQVEASSGDTYIVTNSHVCELAQQESKDKNFLLVSRAGERWMKRQVIEVSGDADLCLLEAWPGLSGLKLGKLPHLGEMVSAVGHPNLGPLTMTSGEIAQYLDVSIITHYMISGDKKIDEQFSATNEPCDKPKNSIVKYTQIKACMAKESMAVRTSVPIFPGSSGSPLVDHWGNVVGVICARDRTTGWGYAVNLEQLALFLEDF